MEGSDDEMDYNNNQNEDIAEHVETNYVLNEEVEVPGTKGQLFKTVLQEGTGPRPPKDSKVSVHYVGTLASDGSKFDSSRDRGEYFEFTLGKGQVIKGWDQGVATMRKGEKAILRCLPEYAYGKAGSPPKIPADSTLNFEVELFDWTKLEDISQNKDKSLMKAVVAEGKDWDRPDYESEVTLNFALLSGNEDDATTLLEKPEWKVTIGDTELPTGLEKALESMKKGEVAIITVNAVTAPFQELPQLVVGQPAHYRVEVVDFVKVKTWSVTNENKVAEAKKRKDTGNEYFKQAKYDKAVQKYKRGLEFIEWVDGLPEEQKNEAKALKVSMWSNTAQCFMNQKNFKSCVEYCNKVLKDEPTNVKALFRRGKALGLSQEWDEGAKDLKKVLEIDPANGDAKTELGIINAHIQEHLKKQKAQYQRMFA